MLNIRRDFVTTLAQRIAEPSQFIHIVTGPRQVGKSTGVRQLLSAVTTPSLYVSADQTTPPTAIWLDEQWKRARALGVGSILVVDEVQKIDRWSEVVKARFDEDRPTSRLKVI